MKKRILVIDDEPDITLIVKLALEGRGDYVVFEENNAKKAIATARTVDPDLIILDIMMPGRSGNDIAADLREDPRLGDVPILFLTALASNEANTANPTVGHRYYMSKPVELTDLVKRVDEFCQKRTPEKSS